MVHSPQLRRSVVQEQLEACRTAAVGQLQDGPMAVLVPVVAKGLTHLELGPLGPGGARG